MYVWREFPRHLARFGWPDSIFMTCTYLVFYSFFLIAPYQIVVILYRHVKGAWVPASVVGLWVLFTALYVGRPIFRILTYLADIEVSLLSLVWLLSTAFVALVMYTMEKERRLNRRKRFALDLSLLVNKCRKDYPNRQLVGTFSDGKMADEYMGVNLYTDLSNERRTAFVVMELSDAEKAALA